MKDFWRQLLKRKVVRSAVAYAVVAWLLLQVGDTLFDMLQSPEWAGRWLVAAVALGFPVTLVLSWIFDLSPSGITVTDADTAGSEGTFEYGDPEPIDVGALELHLTRRNELIGRRKELDIVRERIARALQGKGGIALLGGEPGVGKTRLGEEALLIGRQNGMLPLIGHAYEERGAAFITSSEILEEIMRILPADVFKNVLGPTAPEISKLLPGLRRLYPEIPEPIELPPDQQQRYLFNRLLEFLERLSKCSPLIFMLDDLHWADQSSMLLLEHIVPHLAKLPVLFIITYRDVAADIGDPFHRVLPGLIKQPFVTRIALRSLDFDEIRNLLARLGGASPPDATVELFMRETRGNPFFVHSVYRHLDEERKLFDSDGHWLTDIDELVVPENVRLVVKHRVERLTDAVVDLLRAAAVMGLRFTLDVVERAGEVSTDEMLETIEQAEGSGLVIPTPGGREARYEFSHALVRQTLLDGISTPRRQRLHLRIAEAMQSLYGDRGSHLVNMARHFYQAGTAAKTEVTRRYLDLAGRQLLAASAPDEAIVLFDTALAMDDDMQPVQRAHLLYQKGLALRSLGRWLDAMRDWHEALPILEESAESDIVASVCWELAYQTIWAGQNDDAIALGHRGLRALGDDPGPARGRLLAILGHAYGANCDWENSEIYMSQAVELAESLPDERLLRAEVLISDQYRAEQWGQGSRAAALADRTIAIMREAGSPWNLSTGLGAAMIPYMLNGRFDDAEAIHEEGLALAERHGDIGNEMHFLMIHACIQCFRGNFATGRKFLEAGVNWCLENKLPWTSIHQTWLGMARFWAGDWSAASELLEAAVDSEVASGFTFGTERAHRLILLAYQNDERARSLMRELEPLLPKIGAENTQGRWYAGIATLEAAALLNMNETAATLYPCAAQLVEAGSKVLWTAGLTEKYAAIAAAAGGNWDLANGHFDTALEQADEINYPVGRAEILYWRGRMILQDKTGNPSLARELLGEAHSGFVQLDMPGHARLIADIAAQGPAA